MILVQIMKSESVAEGAKPMVTTIQFSDFKDYGFIKLPSSNFVPEQIGELEHICNFLVSSIM